MYAECKFKVSEVLGRKLTDREAEQMTESIRQAMTRLRHSDPEWGRKNKWERVSAAAKEVAKTYQVNARQRKAALQKQVIAQAECLRQYSRLGTDEDTHAFSAVAQMLNLAWKRSNGVANEYLSQMLDTINGMKGRIFGMVEDANDVRDFVREAFGERTGNEEVHKAWLAFSKTSNEMRERLVANGVDIGKIGYGYIPQSHDSWRVREAAKVLGADKNGVNNVQAWVDFIKPLLDRDKYTNDNGNVMTDDELDAVLRATYMDIVTGGNPDPSLSTIAEDASKRMRRPGARRFQSRFLHFKDAGSFIEYESMFGKGSLSGTLIGHVQKMALDIALVENFGPNAGATFDFLKNLAKGEAQNAAATESTMRLSSKFSDVGLDAIWANLTGETGQTAINHELRAEFFQGFRNLNVIGKLGKAFIASFSDIPSYFVATGFNRMSFMQGLKFLPLAYGKGWKEYATRMGIMSEGMVSDFNRWSGENLTEGWTGKLANLTMKASFLTQFTDATRRAFSLNMLAAAGKMSRSDWKALDAYDRARLEAAGIDEVDWKIFRLAGAEEHKGVWFLNPQRLRKLNEKTTDEKLVELGFTDPRITRERLREAPAKLLSWVTAESEMASLKPDLISRSMTNLGTQKGSISGEIARSFFLFKGFPIAYMRQHWERAQWLQRHGSRANRIEYLAAMAVTSTVFGALSLQVQNLLNGKDLQDMSDSKFWLAAMTKGGGLGFLGDFIANGLDDNSRYGSWGTIQFLGPIAGDVLEGYDLATSIIDKGLYDKETKPAARALRIVRSHTPFVNMWYTSTILDRAVFNELQDYLSPGYLDRMETRTYNSWGQGYWWRPGEVEPSRAPRMATAPEN